MPTEKLSSYMARLGLRGPSKKSSSELPSFVKRLDIEDQVHCEGKAKTNELHKGDGIEQYHMEFLTDEPTISSQL